MSSTLELPHELLLRRYGLQISQLSSHTQQLKKDLDKTITLILNKSQNGQVRITPSTQSKIDTYDRYICDGIFEYLENKEVITEQQSDSLENQMDAKRENVVGSINAEQTQKTNTNTEQKDSGSKIGFWNWE